jgi:predicted phosphodiesterase
LTGCFGLNAQESNEPSFKSDVETSSKPWTHLQFHNDPANFQFAIVSDNTGGMREGVFESAVAKLNLMQPEFVMSVGDLIEGYTESQEQIDKEWDEFHGWLDELEMPFFYVPGNHDISNKVMQFDWEQRFGVRYYSFVYKGVLFIMMDTDDADEGTDWYKVTDAQESYVMEVLEQNQDVRWTFFFMHHPLWTQKDNELTMIEEQLKEENRDYTMFAGHTHHYMSEVRQGNNYYVLATTGGGSRLRGPRFGEFDHITWVTMTEDGPRMANLWLDGILDMDINTPEIQAMADALTGAAKFDQLILTNDEKTFKSGRLLINVENSSLQPIKFEGKFFHHHRLNLSEDKVEIEIPGAGSSQFEIGLSTDEATAIAELGLLQMYWSVSFVNSPYPDLSLNGTYSFEVKPSEIKYITPKQDIFLDRIEVFSNSPWEGLEIKMTTGEKTPDKNGDPLEGPLILTDRNTQVRLRIFDDQGNASGTEERFFRRVDLYQQKMLDNPSPGLEYYYFEGNWKHLPDFEQMEPKSQGIATSYDLNIIAQRPDHFGIVFKGFFYADKSGMYKLYSYSDDGTKLYIHGDLIIDNDGSHSAKMESGYVALEQGWHPIKIEYFEDHGGETLWLGYQAPGMKKYDSITLDILKYEP